MTAGSRLEPRRLFSPELVRKTVMVVAGLAGISLAVGVGLSVRLAEIASWNAAAVARWLPWVLVLGAGSYFARSLRWHSLVRQLAPRLRLGPSLRIYMAGFAMGLTPGRLGEFCKFTLLRQETGVPEAESAPIFPLERATEAASFAALAAAGAVLGHFTPAKLGLSTIGAIVAIPALAVLALALRFIGKRTGRAPDAGNSLLRQLGRGVRSVAAPGPTARALVFAGLARCCDGTMLWCAAHAAGLHVSLAGCALAFGVAGLTGGFSLLPAGVGAVEASLVATLSGLGADPGTALMAALLARMATLWIWIPSGLWFAFRATASTPVRAAPATATAPG